MHPKKKTTLLFFDFITHYGGAQRSTVSLCGRLKAYYDIQILDAYGYSDAFLEDLRRCGLPTDVLMKRGRRVVIGHSEKPVLRLFNLLRQLPHLVVIAQRLKRRIREIRPDLIWTNNTKALFFLMFHRLSATTPIGLFARGWYRKEQLPWWQRILIKQTTDVIFAISNPTKTAMVGWGVDARKIVVVHSALSVARAVENEGVEKLKKKGNFVILVPGTLLYTKGQHTVIDAVLMLKEMGKNNIVVWMAGDSGNGDATGYARGLKSKVLKNGLGENIRFLGWREDMHALMKAADVMVLATHTEGLPRVVQEAILLECPVISTHVGGIPDLITDGVTGLLAKADDARSLAEKLCRVIDDPDNTERMARQALMHYRTHFTRAKQIDGFRSAVERTMATPAHGSK